MREAQAGQAGRDEEPRKHKPHTSSRKWHLTLVYWVMYVAVLVCILLVSLLIMRVLFAFNVLKTPGTALVLTVFVVVTLLTGAVFSQMFIRSITKPILEMSNAARRIAQGDFDIELKENTFAVEIAEMADNFTMMAHELSATEMLRSDFISNVSHEFKTPLSSIVGYATLLQKPELPDEQRQLYSGKILSSARRLSNLTDDVLLLSRLENQEEEPERSTFSLSEQLRESILLFDRQWAEEDRVLDVDLEEVDYCGNAELLSHVWQNLISNALKFTEPGDTISVRLRKVEPEEQDVTPASGARKKPGPHGKAGGGARGKAQAGVEAEGAAAGAGCVVVEVSDTGIGMNEEECHRIFEKFYQADSSHATEGNGLGLSLCRRIVDLHGGSIGVESAPGEGSTFTVTLPVAAPEAAKAQEAA